MIISPAKLSFCGSFQTYLGTSSPSGGGHYIIRAPFLLQSPLSISRALLKTVLTVFLIRAILSYNIAPGVRHG